jgi:DNA-binding SARP family transcriptional activator
METLQYTNGTLARRATARDLGNDDTATCVQLAMDSVDDVMLAGPLERRTDDAQDCTTQLPPGSVEHAALLYSQGRCVAWRDLPLARRSLLEAQQALSCPRDAAAARLVRCARIELELYTWGERGALRELAATFGEHELHEAQAAPDACDALLSHACAAAALAAADPGSPRVATLAVRAYNLLGKVTQGSARMRAASKLLLCTPWLPDGVPLALAVEFGAPGRAGEASPCIRLEWCCVAADWELEWGGRLREAQAAIEEGRAIASRLSLRRALFRLDLLQVRLHLCRGQAVQAEELMRRLAAEPGAGEDHEKAQIGVLKALLDAANGDIRSADAAARKLCRSTKVLGDRQLERARFALALSALCALAGDVPLARDWARQARDGACAGEAARVRIASNMIEARLADPAEGCATDALLRDAFAAHRRGSLHALFPAAPAFAAAIAEAALEAGADTSHARAIILAQELAPEGRACADWPWTVKICALGPACVRLDGKPVSTAGRAQRLLELLRILVAAGPNGRSQQALERQLWADSDAPKAALGVAVHRLRKLLASDKAIVCQGGMVALSREHVWTDVDGLLEICERVDRVAPMAPRQAILRLGTKLLAIYKGHLAEAGEDPWLLSCSSRLRTRFTAAAQQLGTRLEAFGDWHAAGCLYRRMLDVEPLCETAYRGLMRVAHAQGDLAAAFAHYRFCRDTLSIVLNQPPSPDTRRLAESLGLFGDDLRRVAAAS